MNNKIVNEQAGFRKRFSCEDQSFVLHTVIKIRLGNGSDTFCAFIDLEKCFHWIDRKLLYYK